MALTRVTAGVRGSREERRRVGCLAVTAWLAPLPYSTIEQAYQQRKGDGSLAPAVWGGWDLINNLQYGPKTC